MPQEETPVVVSIINLKGGVGKTTLAVMLARHAASRVFDLDVLAVDLDPQANLSQALLQRGYEKIMDPKNPSCSIVELFKGFAPPSRGKPGPSKLKTSAVVQRVRDKLDVLPSRFDFSDNLIESARVDETVLANFIRSHMTHKDLVLIDCAPTESILTRTAYHASGYILVPVKPELFSTVGFPLMKESLDQFRSRNRGNEIKVKGVLINHPDYGPRPSPHHQKALSEIRRYASIYDWPILNNAMSYSRGYPKYMAEPSPLHPGKAAGEQSAICREILQSLGFSRKQRIPATDK
ncbi:MAG: ParA family protein [Gammaproteobacteria bacterium]|nr:ParA family protein [Gammaproteobacteria bacterium]